MLLGAGRIALGVPAVFHNEVSDTERRLYRDGDLLLGPLTLGGGTLDSAGAALSTPASFEQLPIDFF